MPDDELGSLARRVSESEDISSLAKKASSLDPNFQQKLDKMVSESGGRIKVKSGYRSFDEQKSIYDRKVAQFGEEATRKSKAAPPGKSRHQMGLAADLSGDLDWAHANAKKYGLHFPVKGDPVHVELAPISRPTTARTKQGAGPAASAPSAASMRAATPQETTKYQAEEAATQKRISAQRRYDPSDPLGKAKSMAELEKENQSLLVQLRGSIRDMVTGAVDPRMLPVEAAILGIPTLLAGAGAPARVALGASRAKKVLGVAGATAKTAEAAAGAAGVYTGGKAAVEAYQQGKPGAAIGYGLGAALAGAGTAKLARDIKTERLVTGKEKPGATVQTREVSRPTAETVPTGKGRENLGGGSKGKSESGQGQKVAGKGQKEETLVSAAYKHEGKVETGATHPEILNRLGVKGFGTRESRNTPDFGFKTSTGRFVSREEAAKIAEKSGQKIEQFDIGPKGKPVAHSDQIATPKVTSARKAMMAKDRAELDLPELPEAERKSWQTSLSNAKSKGLGTPEQAKALSTSVLEKPRSLNDEETAGIVIRSQQIKNAHQDTLKSIESETDPNKLETHRQVLKLLQDEFDLHSSALKASGTEKGRTLASQKLTINKDYDLISIKNRAKAEKAAPLGPKQEQAYADLAKRHEELKARVDELEQRTLQKEMQRTKKAADVSSPKFGESNTVFTRERADAARARLQEKMGRLSAGIDPAIVKDAVEVGGYYIEGGVRSFAAWSKQMKADFPKLDNEHLKAAWTNLTNDKRLQTAKKRTATSIQSIESRMKSGDLEPPARPPKIVEDRELHEARLKKARLEYEIEKKIASERQPHPGDYVNAIQRFSILSGYSSAAKIGMASAERVALDTAENMFGQALAKVPGFKQIAEKAPSEGLGSSRADIKAFVKAWNAPDMWKKGTTGISSVDEAYSAITGKYPEARPTNKVLHVLELPGQIHGAIKLPAQRAAWERGLSRRAEYEVRQGNSLEEPAVQIRVAEGAYQDSLNAIFRGNNIIVDAWNRGMSGLANVPPKYGKAAQLAGKAAQVGAKLELPIVRIPTNLAFESLQYGPIGLAKAATEIVSAKGIKNLTPAQANIVMRASKKGLIGTALMTTVWFNADKVKVAEKKDDLRPGMKKGDMLLFGTRIPNLATHHPLIMGIKTAAIGRREYDKSHSLLAAAGHATIETAREMPFADQMQRLGRIRTEKDLGKHLKDIGRSFIPKDLADKVMPYEPSKSKKGGLAAAEKALNRSTNRAEKGPKLPFD